MKPVKLEEMARLGDYSVEDLFSALSTRQDRLLMWLQEQFGISAFKIVSPREFRVEHNEHFDCDVVRVSQEIEVRNDVPVEAHPKKVSL